MSYVCGLHGWSNAQFSCPRCEKFIVSNSSAEVQAERDEALAEVERLTLVVNYLRNKQLGFYDGTAIGEVSAERDRLRADVRKLEQANEELMTEAASLESQRDAALAEEAKWKHIAAVQDENAHRWLEQVNALQAEVSALRGALDGEEK